MSDHPKPDDAAPVSHGGTYGSQASVSGGSTEQNQLLIAEQLSARIQMLGDLANGVGHEVNNLLTVMLASLHQLRRQPLDERGQQQLDRAERSAREVGRLVGQMLALSRSRSDAPEIIDLNQVAGEFDKMLGQAAGYGEGLTVSLELVPQALPAQVDRGQLQLALLHLVRNAAEAMPGAGTVTLRTRGPRLDGMGDQPTIEVAVSDTGAGMLPEVVQRATGPLADTEASSQEGERGLRMAQRFMAASGGKLTIETAAGEGTTVRLVFPLATHPMEDRGGPAPGRAPYQP